ncbi:Hypothetical protein A7982_07090 [Minicystis rosea]|nr:Hypothetical protein A7982_07090 [Minicystis rosea]
MSASIHRRLELSLPRELRERSSLPRRAQRIVDDAPVSDIHV